MAYRMCRAARPSCFRSRRSRHRSTASGRSDVSAFVPRSAPTNSDTCSSLIPTDRPVRQSAYIIHMQGGSGVSSHRQPRQCRGTQGPKTEKGAQSDPNYKLSRPLARSECLPGGGKNYSYAAVGWVKNGATQAHDHNSVSS